MVLAQGALVLFAHTDSAWSIHGVRGLVYGGGYGRINFKELPTKVANRTGTNKRVVGVNAFGSRVAIVVTLVQTFIAH